MAAVQAVVMAIAARLADDRRACNELAAVLRRLGRRPEDDPDYLRWSAAADALDALLVRVLDGM